MQLLRQQEAKIYLLNSNYLYMVQVWVIFSLLKIKNIFKFISCFDYKNCKNIC